MPSVEYIDAIRAIELETILPFIRPGARILEIGAGSGRQALELSRRGFDVSAIDLATSDYVDHRVFEVRDYDGRKIPFPDAGFDVVFSSNVLEHVADLAGMHAEIRRVLKPDGECVHVLPTHSWRFWTSATLVPAAAQALFRPHRYRELRRIGSSAIKRHGERGNTLMELLRFHPAWWRRHFRKQGFEVAADRPIGLFYTAQGLFGPRLPLDRRRALSETLGSTTHIFHLRQRAPAR